MDVDLEFHQYPTLFSPGSWPDFGRLALPPYPYPSPNPSPNPNHNPNPDP